MVHMLHGIWYNICSKSENLVAWLCMSQLSHAPVSSPPQAKTIWHTCTIITIIVAIFISTNIIVIVVIVIIISDRIIILTVPIGNKSIS